jgi:hypothetical protein
MKYIFFYINLFFFKLINAFTPFIKKYFVVYKSSYFIKSFSGLFQNKKIQNPVSVIETTIDSEKKIIIPGYISHDPKVEAIKIYNKNIFSNHLLSNQ